MDVPYLTGRVTDNAQILSDDTIKNIGDLLKAHEEKTTNQIAVLTVASLDGTGIEEYANKVFNTWKLGQNAHARAGSTRGTARRFDDPLEILGRTQRKPAEQVLGRSLKRNEMQALATLGLDENAKPDDAKAKYKMLVKRLHPDANGGSRANEDTLKAVIHAYDTLRASGFC